MPRAISWATQLNRQIGLLARMIKDLEKYERAYIRGVATPHSITMAVSVVQAKNNLKIELHRCMVEFNALKQAAEKAKR